MVQVFPKNQRRFIHGAAFHLCIHQIRKGQDFREQVPQWRRRSALETNDTPGGWPPGPPASP
jgi:hypothetical protein